MKRQDGYYRVSVRVDGKRHYFYGNTLKEANAKKNEFLNKSALPPVTFADYAREFLKYKQSLPTLGDSQKQDIQGKIDILNETFGNRHVDTINTADFQLWLNDLAAKNPRTGKPTAQSTLKKYLEIIKAIYTYNEIVPDVTKKLVIKSMNEPKKRRALTAEERQMIIDTPHRAQTLAMLELFAGLRRGEASALTWNDIDFNAGSITINKSYDFKNNVTKSPKTKSGIRTVPLLDVLRDYLLPLKSSGLVVTNAHGGQLSHSAIIQLWKSYMVDLDCKYGGRKKCNPNNARGVYTIKTFGQHDLRHTFCTMLFESGVDVKTAQYLMGHANLSVTMDIYTHLSNEHKESEVQKLNTFLQN